MRTVQLGVVVVVVALAGAVPQAATAGLKVVEIGVMRPSLGAGGKSMVKVVVRNTGRKAVRGGTVRFRLAGRGSKPLAGTAKAGRVKARRSKTVSGTITLPKALAPGAHAVVACLGKRCAKRAAPIAVRAPPPADSLGSLSVTPRPVADAAPRTGVISRDGGAMSMVAGGLVYTLVVPPNALANDTRITMTPLTAIDGTPFAGGLVGGVQLEPAGVEFARPAALVISGEDVRPAPGQVAYGYDASGTDFHLAPFFAKAPDFAAPYMDPAKSIVVPVEHFSGVGVGPATDLETARQLRYEASDARNRLAQDLVKELAASEPTEATLTQFLEQVILPEAAAASFSDAMYESAVRDFVGWQRQRELLGHGDEPTAAQQALLDRINQLLKIAWEKLVDRAEKRCYAGDFSIIARIIPLERLRELTGMGGTPNEFSEGFKRCFKFELRVVSRVDHSHSGGPEGLSDTSSESYALKATVPLHVEGDGIGVLAADLVGSAPFTYSVIQHNGQGEVNFGFGGNQCRHAATGQTVAGQLTVQQGWMGLVIVGSDVKRKVNPIMVFDVGDPQEEINYQCQGHVGNQQDSTNDNQLERNWLRWWGFVHALEHANLDTANHQPGEPDPGPWRFDFQPKAWPLMGSYVIDETLAEYGTHVTETWEIVHTPPKAPGKA
jgi:hypothetical protein